jgi:hypothetical protein
VVFGIIYFELYGVDAGGIGDQCVGVVESAIATSAEVF